MPPETKKLLEDIRDAAQFIFDQTQSRSFEDYERERLVRDAVERNFIVIGEAFTRLARIDATMAGRFSNFPQIVGFRNVVVHGYDMIEDAIVWGIILNEIPRLLIQLTELQMHGATGV